MGNTNNKDTRHGPLTAAVAKNGHVVYLGNMDPSVGRVVRDVLRQYEYLTLANAFSALELEEPDNETVPPDVPTERRPESDPNSPRKKAATQNRTGAC